MSPPLLGSRSGSPTQTHPPKRNLRASARGTTQQDVLGFSRRGKAPRPKRLPWHKGLRFLILPLCGSIRSFSYETYKILLYETYINRDPCVVHILCMYRSRGNCDVSRHAHRPAPGAKESFRFPFSIISPPSVHRSLPLQSPQPKTMNDVSFYYKLPGVGTCTDKYSISRLFINVINLYPAKVHE